MKATLAQQWKGAARQLKLTTKMANKGFYKGTGTGSTGRHTKHGGYVIEWEKVRTYVVPKNLKDFNVCRFNTMRGVAAQWQRSVALGSVGLWFNMLTGLQLTPFVTTKIRPVKGRFENDPKGAFSPESYLAKWKAENGED